MEGDYLSILRRTLYDTLVKRGFSPGNLNDVITRRYISRSDKDPYKVFVFSDEDWNNRDLETIKAEYSFPYTEEEEWQAIEALFFIGSIQRDVKEGYCPIGTALYLGGLLVANRLTYRDLPPNFPKRTPSRKSKLKNLGLDRSNKTRDERMTEAVKKMISENPELNKWGGRTKIARMLSEDPEFQGLSLNRYQEIVSKILNNPEG